MAFAVDVNGNVPAIGGTERLVLEHAGSPEVLPDGSLLVIREDKNEDQIHYLVVTPSKNVAGSSFTSN